MYYRPEIDGLRAVAVMPVLLFHAGLLHGGFLGVDLFFMISGYLITSILLQDLVNNKFSLAKFYERRARRILPMLLIITAFTIPLGLLFMSGVQFKDLGTSIIYVQFFASNFWFAKTVNYFSIPTNLLPLLHTWSLAVEEQYYLIYPLLLFGLWRYAKRYLLVTLFILVIASLIVVTLLNQNYRAINFYLLPSRVWELMLGGMLAYCELKYGRVNHKLLTKFLPTLGLITILASMYLFANDNHNPNLATLIPALGAMAIIWYSGSNDITTRLLSSKIFVGIGLISYSVYLWHQPILAYMRLANLGFLTPSNLYTFIPLTLGLSWFSWRWIEMPMRNRNMIPRAKFFTLIITLSITILLCAIWIVKNNGFPDRGNVPVSVRKSINMPNPPRECNYQYRTDKAWNCIIGNQTKEHVDFVIVGDSHVRGAFNGIAAAIASTNTSAMISHLPGCVPINDLAINDRIDNEECIQRNEMVFNYVKQHKVPEVIFIARWALLVNTSTDPNVYKQQNLNFIRDKLANTIAAYNAAGTKVVIMEQVPEQKFYPPLVYEAVFRLPPVMREQALTNYSLSTSIDATNQQVFLTLIGPELLAKVTLLRPNKILCNKTACMLGDLQKCYYNDTNHLSKDGSKLLAPMFVPVMQTK